MISRDLNHIVALSGGKDSTAMALRLAEVEPREYLYVCTPTGNELQGMKGHWEKLGELLGSDLIQLSPDHGLIGESFKQKCLPNWRMRWCTRILKILPFQAFIASKLPCAVYVGIRADEDEREGVDYGDGVTIRRPLVEWGWDLAKVRGYLNAKYIEIPPRTDCALCFFQTLAEWWHLWREYPEEFEKGVQWEKVFGHTLRSDGRDTWPASLEDLREEFKRGRIPRGVSLQGNLFEGMDQRKRMCSICAR